MSTIKYASKVLGNYCNTASVYYDRPNSDVPLGSGNTFVIADHNQDLVVIQGSRIFGDTLSYTFPRDTLTDTRTKETVHVNKYGLGGGCVLIGSDLHCYVSVQVSRNGVNATELWHIVIGDIVR